MNARARVAAALARLPFASSEVGADRFRLVLARDGAIDVRIADEERWLELDASGPHDASCVESGPDLLERGAHLAGLARIVLAAGPDLPRMRADLPLDLDDAALAPLLRATVMGLASAQVLDGTSPSSLEACANGHDGPAPACSVDDLERFCADAGFAVPTRRETLLAVDLGLDDVAARARVACEPRGVRAWVEFDALRSAPSPLCARALATFLLAASAGVRVVRPFATHAAAVAGFEARLGPAPCARLVAHALAALRVAAALAAREAAVLARDPEIATTFLALREDQPARDVAPRSVNHSARASGPEGEQR